MHTFTELLPETKSSRHNALAFTPSETTPGAGLLHLSTDRSWCEYLLVGTRTAAGREVLLAKTTASQGDKEESEYRVFVGPAGCSCGCKGFFYGRGKPCKHVEAVRCLIDNGRL